MTPLPIPRTTTPIAAAKAGRISAMTALLHSVAQRYLRLCIPSGYPERRRSLLLSIA